MSKRYRRRHDDEDGNSVVPPGGSVHVPIHLCDSASVKRRVHDHFSRRAIADAIRKDHQICSGHKPMPVADALACAASSGVNDSANLRDAFAAREKAFADLCRRSARAYIDGPAVAPPLNQLPPTPYDQQRPPRDRDDDDDGDDDNGNGDDRFDLNEAMRARDRARDAQYDRQLWRSPPSIYSNTPVGSISQNGGRLDPCRADEPERLRRATVLR
jgi:hypothetical protein